MEAIYEELKLLYEKYPMWVKLYQPANPDYIIATERILKINIDTKLKELYKFTNGFGIVDYCCLGVGNKKIANLIDNYPLELEYNLNSYLINFMGTSGGEKYAYLENNDAVDHKVYFYDRDNLEIIEIANNMEEFFNKFLSKIKVLLSIIKKNDMVMYFNDERLPEGLSEW